jgi:hypothetical protein
MSKEDEALRIITLNVALDLIHHTKDKKNAKEILDTIKTLFGTINTTKVTRFKTKLCNLKKVTLPTLRSILRGLKPKW